MNKHWNWREWTIRLNYYWKLKLYHWPETLLNTCTRYIEGGEEFQAIALWDSSQPLSRYKSPCRELQLSQIDLSHQVGGPPPWQLHEREPFILRGMGLSLPLDLSVYAKVTLQDSRDRDMIPERRKEPFLIPWSLPLSLVPPLPLRTLTESITRVANNGGQRRKGKERVNGMETDCQVE